MESTFGTGILKFPVNIQLTSITYRFYLMKIHNWFETRCHGFGRSPRFLSDFPCRKIQCHALMKLSLESSQKIFLYY